MKPELTLDKVLKNHFFANIKDARDMKVKPFDFLKLVAMPVEYHPLRQAYPTLAGQMIIGKDFPLNEN